MKTTVSLKSYIFSLLISLSLTMLIIAILSAVFTFFNANEKVVKLAPTILFFFSSFLSGFFASRKANHTGWFSGMVASFFYSIIIILLSVIFSPNAPTIGASLKTILSSLPFGIIGGIIGINTK